MGARLVFFSVLLLCQCFVIFSQIGLVSGQKTDTICLVKGCNCTRNLAQKIVNCTLNSGQELELKPSDVPVEVSEIFINGGSRIVLGPKSFNLLGRLAILHIDGAKTLAIEKESFYNLSSPSLLIRIQNCDHLDIKTGAFENVQSSIETEIVKCASVAVQKSPFSRLTSAVFRDIAHLKLATGAFGIKNSGNIGRHGPVTVISFDNVKITKIPQRTFSSALAEIDIRNSEIHEIDNEAFSANQIDAITITSSTVNYLRSGAFVSYMLVYNLKINNCTITTIESRAVMAAMSNLTVQHSRITDIGSGAINSTTVAKIEIIGNEIVNLNSSGFCFQSWNTISMEQNIIKCLRASFLVAPMNQDVEEFKFIGNDVYHLDPGALDFVPGLGSSSFIFLNNFFNQTCHCSMNEWIEDLIGAKTSKVQQIRDNAFCTVNDLLSQCFELPVGVINIQNFTELVCNFTIYCQPYKGETKIVNTTSKMFADERQPPERTTWLTLIIASAVVLILAAIVTFTFMLIRGSRWLKRTGYFRKIQYNQNEPSNEEENTIETVDESERLDISEDLSMELLQDLKEKLDDPNTHQEASELIEQLYQKYIRTGGSENNNQQDEEAHLYEELGNLAEQDPSKLQNDSRSILKMMEERFNLQFDEEVDERRPALVGEYSEPSDAAVHLYSELKQNKQDKEESENRDSLKSRASSHMAFRPLPEMPGSSKM